MSSSAFCLRCWNKPREIGKMQNENETELKSEKEKNEILFIHKGQNHVFIQVEVTFNASNIISTNSKLLSN
jgi:hypothetical protein